LTTPTLRLWSSVQIAAVLDEGVRRARERCGSAIFMYSDHKNCYGHIQRRVITAPRHHLGVGVLLEQSQAAKAEWSELRYAL